ncbi:MAG: peptide chain release factor N(5)-glutamine methyltransferase [Oscillospiraceae bacterium]|nr:peptide chain release factor N(5)-glutamine methyltransferase [Oscillospiraceae bacterium]
MQQAEISAAGFELDLLLEAFVGISKAQRLSYPEQLLGQDEMARIEAALSRREAGEPLQYLLGWWEFYGRRFAVGPGVLIPRADTEILVEQALAELANTPSPKVADLCAGSGCVGITVACERPDAQIVLLELSPQAAAYCNKNSKALAPRCRFLQADVLRTTAGLTGLDAVLSNPPYIPSEGISGLQREVRQEPAMALDGSADGLRFYRGIPLLWRKALKPGGLLGFEIGFDQGQAVRDLLADAGFSDIRVVKDYSGNDRVVLGRNHMGR